MVESNDSERRLAPRYTIPARVLMHREGGPQIPATAVNISSSGMLVRPDQPIPFDLGEAVTVDVELSCGCDKALSTWGIGVVARLDGECTAIQLHAGNFCPCAGDAPDGC